jgi:hypothetical protein
MGRRRQFFFHSPLSTAFHACLPATDPDTSSGWLTNNFMIQSDELREFLEALQAQWEQLLTINYEDYVCMDKLLRNWIQLIQVLLDEE